MGAELLGYPISTEITRAQSRFSIHITSARSYYAGCSTLLMAGPALLLKLKLVDHMVDWFQTETHLGYGVSLVLSSAVCEMAGCIIRNPAELMRQ
jgi:hypothetical protein